MEEAAQDVTWVSLPTKKKKARHTTDALGSGDISKTEIVMVLHASNNFLQLGLTRNDVRPPDRSCMTLVVVGRCSEIAQPNFLL